MKEEEEVKVEVKKILDFLGKLATDDSFRSQYEQNPAKVLKEYGIEIPADARVTVPPKEALVAMLNNLAAETLNSPASYSWWRPLPPWTGPFPLPWSWNPLPPWTGPFPLPWGWQGPYKK